MKGLLMKDMIYTSRYYSRVVLMILLLYRGALLFLRPEGEQVHFFSSVLAVMFSTFPIATFSWDNSVGWDAYALSMPVSRRMLMVEKYLFGLLCILAGCLFGGGFLLLSYLLGARFSLAESAMAFYLVAGCALLVAGVLICATVRLGAERARTVLFALVLLPTALGYLMKNMGLPLPDGRTLKTLIGVFPLAAAAVYGNCCWSSIRYYERKEIG